MNQYENPLDSFDLSNISVTGKTKALLPEGWYAAQITDGGIKRSKKGTDYLFFQLTVRDDSRYAGRTVGMFFFLWSEPNEQSLKMYKQFRIACGLNPDHGGYPEEFIGRMVKACVSLKTDANGSQSNKVRYCEKLEQGYVQPWDR